jgi:uncharacterized membrane protein
MDDARNVIADNVRAIFVVIGVGLLILGGVGPGPIGIVSVLGIITLLAAVVLVSPIAALLRADAEPVSDGPFDDLREQYISGDIDEAEFERRMERVLDDTEYDRVETDTDAERVSISSSVSDSETE